MTNDGLNYLSKKKTIKKNASEYLSTSHASLYISDFFFGVGGLLLTCDTKSVYSYNNNDVHCERTNTCCIKKKHLIN